MTCSRVGSTGLAITIRPDQAERGAASRVPPNPPPLLPPRPRVWPRAPWGPPPPRGSRALPPPFHRNNRAPLPPAPATPEPPFQVENLCGGAQPSKPALAAGPVCRRRIRGGLEKMLSSEVGPRVRIRLPPGERWYGAGGEEMAPSSL